MARITKSSEFLRHNFSADERLRMGSDLAAAHNSLAAIEEEEEYIKASFKERKKSVEQTIGKLSRDIGSGFTMQNIECNWIYDCPNVGEVTYMRIDTGEIVKTRSMSLQERQQELPLEPVAVNPQKPEETQAAVEEFFDPDKFPEGYIIDAEFVDPEVDTHQEEIDDAANDYGQAVPETPAEPEASRQRLLTMKGRKKKIIEEQVPIGGDIFTDESSVGKSPSGEDFDF